jgi:hypothetical protein
MRVYILFFIILLYHSNGVAENHYIDISWNRPQVISNCNLQYLRENLDESKVISNIKQNQSEEFDFALYSFTKFKSSIKNYFAKSQHSHDFLNYRTANNNNFADLRINVLAGYTYSNSSKEDYYDFIYKGLKLTGNINNKLLFYGYWWAGHFSGNTDYAKYNSELVDGWIKDPEDDDFVYLDNLSAKITYKTFFGSLSIGRNKYSIGSNIGSSIILNDDCNEYGYFSGKIELGKLSISLMHASLIADSSKSELYNDLSNQKTYEDKFLVVHNIDWRPNSKLHLFIGEEIIYGNRAIDLNYLLPHTFYRIIEHNLRDRDNVLIFCGVNWKFFTNSCLYFNFILDEMSKSKFFSNWWGNKYAVQSGIAIGSGDSSLRWVWEFTAVRPWLYTHKYFINRFSHDGVGLGFQEGSNLIQFSTEINWKFRKNIFCDFNLAFTRQGSIGNSFTINYEDRPSDYVTWLEGDISDKLAIKTVLTWQFLNHHGLKLSLQTTKLNVEDIENEIFISYFTYY